MPNNKSLLGLASLGGFVAPWQFAAGNLWTPADTDGLVSVWDPSVEQGGQVLVDTYGGYDGELGSTSGADTNDPTWQESPPALVYTTDDYCEVGGHAALRITGDLTMVSAFYLVETGTTAPYLISHSKSGNPTAGGIGYALYLQRGAGLRGAAGTYWDGAAYKTTARSGINYEFETWNTVIQTIQAGQQCMYFNGGSQGCTAHANNVTAIADAENYLGATYAWSTLPSNPMEGMIGVQMIYAANKTAGEVAAIHNNIRDNFSGYSLPEAT